MFAAQAHWRAMRDQAHELHQAMRGNSANLRHLLDSNGFDALHDERALVTRNFELLAELRDSAQKLYGHAGNMGENLRSSMTRTVEIVEKELEQIDNLPLLTPEVKESMKDAIIDQVNAELIAESQAAATALGGRVAAHQALASSLPWFTSTANAAPYSPPPSTSNGSSAQMMSSGFKQNPALGGNSTNGSDHGTGGQSTPQQGTKSAEQPSHSTDGQHTPDQGKGSGQKPSHDTGGQQTP